jgi:GTP-binding protein LepA
MVFSGLFPIDGDDFENLRESLEKLKLNDASITYTPESSGALGFGFRCGFLGLLHMEIVKERLEREFGLALIATAPSVEYRLTRTDGTIEAVDNPADMPEAQKIASIEEPFFKVSIITPTEYTGTLMDLCQKRRGEMKKMEYLSPERVELVYEVPLAEVVVDFFDQMKSRTKGYASLDYELSGYRPSPLVKVDLLLNGLPADAFSTDRAPRLRLSLRGADVREAQGADPATDVRRADPGGDRWQGHRSRDGEGEAQGRARQVLRRRHHRKRKLLEKQKEGKKKMKSIGRVEVPGDVFINALKLDD